MRPDEAPISSPWLRLAQTATYAAVSPATLCREVKAGRLRAARVGGRRALRFRREWIDEWLTATSTPVEVRRLSGPAPRQVREQSAGTGCRSS